MIYHPSKKETVHQLICPTEPRFFRHTLIQPNKIQFDDAHQKKKNEFVSLCCLCLRISVYVNKSFVLISWVVSLPALAIGQSSRELQVAGISVILDESVRTKVRVKKGLIVCYTLWTIASMMPGSNSARRHHQSYCGRFGQGCQINFNSERTTETGKRNKSWWQLTLPR